MNGLKTELLNRTPGDIMVMGLGEFVIPSILFLVGDYGF